MKFYLEIDKERAPSVHVVTDKVTSVITKIEELCKLDEQGDLIYGYNDGEICPLKLSEVTCFFTKDGKVFARVGGEEFVTKLRIKDIEEIF